ncbi:MAG: small ribosomal subunit Rsm22 family protein [Nitrospirota bacterium]
MPQYRALSKPLVRALSEATGLDGLEVPPALCRGVAALSRLFTRERNSLAACYLADEALRVAYLAYYLPVNLAKVQALLAEMPAYPVGAFSPARPLSVLDLGSGPGTAALGVLDWILQSPSLSPIPVEVVAVDRSAPGLVECERLWHLYTRLVSAPGARLLPVHADLERSGRLGDLKAGKRGPYDLIVMANTLNELFLTSRDPIRRRAKLVRALLDLLHESGTLMIVEPALREVSRNLHRLRDILLEEHACTVYSPCLHERPCPALVKEDDWCHEERPWTPPPLVTAIDRQVGFIKDALKFSYLLLRKDGRTIVPRAPTVYRVVSELREMKGEKRAWLCNETGRPEVGRLDRERSETNTELDDWHRGAIVQIDQIVRKDRKGRESTIGRIPANATVEVLRLV